MAKADTNTAQAKPGTTGNEHPDRSPITTDIAAKQAKPEATPYKRTVGEGLHMLVHPSGSKYWRFSYRFDGKQKTLAIGVYPDISLSQARKYRDEARQLIANGTDPSELRKAEKVTLSDAKQAEVQAAKIEQLIQDGEPLPGSFRAIGIEWAAKYLGKL